ncbi:MAG: hypothetical protein HC786_25045 [Richelia sp. CSU_2_1]|nr:hypothetical protein [Richelia sp. CSU_2_1]
MFGNSQLKRWGMKNDSACFNKHPKQGSQFLVPYAGNGQTRINFSLR